MRVALHDPHRTVGGKGLLHEWPGSVALGAQVRALGALGNHQCILGRDQHRQFDHRGLDLEAHGVLVDRGDTGGVEEGEGGKTAGRDGRVQQATIGIGHIRGIEIGAVVELHAFAQMERPFGCIGVRFPGLRQDRYGHHGVATVDQGLIDGADVIDAVGADQRGGVHRLFLAVRFIPQYAHALLGGQDRG
ncbi:hypothetical protein D3C73_957480 [compost metagenome]